MPIPPPTSAVVVGLAGAAGADAAALPAPKTICSRRHFSPSVTISVRVTVRPPAAVNVNTCCPGSTGVARPSSLSTRTSPSTVTPTAVTSAPEASFAWKAIVGRALSTSSSHFAQSLRTIDGHAASTQRRSWSLARLSFLPRRRSCALVLASRHCSFDIARAGLVAADRTIATTRAKARRTPMSRRTSGIWTRSSSRSASRSRTDGAPRRHASVVSSSNAA